MLVSDQQPESYYQLVTFIPKVHKVVPYIKAYFTGTVIFVSREAARPD
jgi:hypothetical protein